MRRPRPRSRHPVLPRHDGMPARTPLGPFVLAIATSCAAAAGCARGGASPAADAALADTLARRITDAYDFSRPDVVGRLMDLYPSQGPVVSAAAGQVTTSREALRAE